MLILVPKMASTTTELPLPVESRRFRLPETTNFHHFKAEMGTENETIVIVLGLELWLIESMSYFVTPPWKNWVSLV